MDVNSNTRKTIKTILSPIIKPIYHISYGAAINANQDSIENCLTKITELKAEIEQLKTVIDELKTTSSKLAEEVKPDSISKALGLDNYVSEINDLEFPAKYIYYYHGGAGNHGCEALVRTITSLCEIPRSNLGIYSYRPEQDREFGILNLASYIKKSDLTADEIPEAFSPDTIAVSIGGDNYCGYPIPQLAKYNRVFHNNGAKTALIGCSIEPDNLEHGEIVGDLCQFDLITARESITYDALISKGVAKNIHLVPDSAFTLPIEPSGITLPKNTIGLNVSDMVTNGKDNLVLKNALKLIEYILDKTDYNIALIPHVHQDFNDDDKILKQLYGHFSENPRIILINTTFNASKIKHIVSQCVMLIAARTHCSIAGYSSCVPTLVLGYSVKSKGIARDIFGTEENYVKSVHSLKNDEEFKNAFIWLDKNKTEIKKHLSSFIPSYTKKASEVKKLLTSLNTVKEKPYEYKEPTKKAKIGQYDKGTLSIITSCYNSQDYLYRYLDSILNQTNHNIQLILVNDGSTDRTEKIILDYLPVLEKQGIKVIYLKQKNGGISAAYNTALQYLSGEYFCWCDSDNFYSPKFVETILNYFKKHPKANILRHDGYLVPEEEYNPRDIFENTSFSKFSENSPNPNEPKLFMNSILEKNWHFGNIVLKTSSFDKVSKRHIYPSRDGQNWQLCLPMLYAYDAHYISDPLFYFIIRNSSVSHQNVNNNVLLFQQLDGYHKILIETINSINPPDKDTLLKIIEQKYICVKLQYAKNTYDDPNIEYYTKLFKEKVEPNNLYEKALSDIK